MTRISCLDAARIAALDPEDLLCVDIETTGLSPSRDEILSVAVVDGAGSTMYCRFLRPVHNLSWEDASEVNGITPEMVEGKPPISEELDRISDILSGARVIAGYNHIAFDLPFLKNSGVKIPDVPACDVMLDYMPINGERNSNGTLRRVSLSRCAEHYGYRFRAHDALEDAKATVYCYRRVAIDQEAML